MSREDEAAKERADVERFVQRYFPTVAKPTARDDDTEANGGDSDVAAFVASKHFPGGIRRQPT